MGRFWRAAISVTGIAGVGALVFLTLYKKWLDLPLFHPLSQPQTFVLMLVFLGLTFLALLSMLVVYMWSRRSRVLARVESAADGDSSGQADFMRKRCFILGYTLQLYLGMHLDETVREANSMTITSLREQINHLLLLCDLSMAPMGTPQGLDQDKVVSQVCDIDRNILAKLEVMGTTRRAYYVNGKWLGLCLPAVAAAKVQGVSPGEIHNLLSLVVERYEDNRVFDRHFPVSRDIQARLESIRDDIARLSATDAVDDGVYEALSAKVLGLMQEFD